MDMDNIIGRISGNAQRAILAAAHQRGFSTDNSIKLTNQLEKLMNEEISLKSNRQFQKAQDLYTEYLNTVMSLQDAKENHREVIAVAYNNRGHLKYLSVDFDGAVEDYNEALKYNDQLATVFYNRGTIKYRMGYFEEALQDMEKANKLSPDTTEFILALDRCKLEIPSPSGNYNTN